MKRHYLFDPMPRSNLVYIWQFLFFVAVMQLLYGCSVGLVSSAVTEPESLVGKYFEVQPDDGKYRNPVFAAQGIEELKAIKQTMHDPVALRNGIFYGQGFADLNQGVNSEQAAIKLIFQVIDFTRVPGERDTFFKIKVCNKQYLGTTWWIRAGNLVIATPIDSPYAHEFSNDHKATVRHGDKNKKNHKHAAGK